MKASKKGSNDYYLDRQNKVLITFQNNLVKPSNEHSSTWWKSSDSRNVATKLILEIASEADFI